MAGILMNGFFPNLSINCSLLATFDVLIGVTLIHCIDECLRRRQCDRVAYQRAFQTCSLQTATPSGLEFNDFSSTLGNCIGIIKMEMDPYRTSLRYDVCDRLSVTCSLNERCTTIGSKSSCQTVSCLYPPVVQNAKYSTLWTAIGRTMKFTCKGGYTAFKAQLMASRSDLLVTCSHHGIWSDPGVACQKDCDMPIVPHSYTIKTAPFVYTTILRMYCSDGYDSANPLMIRCDVTGEWVRHSGDPCSIPEGNDVNWWWW